MKKHLFLWKHEPLYMFIYVYIFIIYHYIRFKYRRLHSYTGSCEKNTLQNIFKVTANVN